MVLLPKKKEKRKKKKEKRKKKKVELKKIQRTRKLGIHKIPKRGSVR